MLRYVYSLITTLILTVQVVSAAAAIDGNPEKGEEALPTTKAYADAVYNADFFKGRLLFRERHATALNCITAQYSAPAQILDIGSGIGFHTHALTKQGYHVTAVDPGNSKENAVLWGKTNGFYDGATLFETTLQELPDSLHGTFDAAFAYMFLIDWDSYPDFFTKLHLSLKDDAYVMLWVNSSEVEMIFRQRLTEIETVGFSLKRIFCPSDYDFVSLCRLQKVKKKETQVL